MSCKVCGRPGRGTRLLAFMPASNVVELLCWTCRYWLDTGKVYDVR